MKNKNASQWIADYINKQGFSVEQIAWSTGVSVDKLQLNTDKELDFDELCKVCIEIGITPEFVRESLGI